MCAEGLLIGFATARSKWKFGLKCLVTLDQRQGVQLWPQRLFGNPCFTQIHPICIRLSSEHQSKLTLTVMVKH